MITERTSPLSSKLLTTISAVAVSLKPAADESASSTDEALAARSHLL
jgi:hypothetical protein